jgi:uncharacterized membrane protein YkvA (DUF1232 family)
MPPGFIRSTGLLLSVWSRVRLATRLVREPRVPLLIKMLPLAAVLYVLFPLDFAADFLPLLGQLDDLTLVLVAIGTFLRLCPAEPVSFHQEAIARGRRYSPMPAAGTVIDAEWRRE